MIIHAPERAPKELEQEKEPSLEGCEKSLEKLRTLLKTPNANTKLRSTDLRYKKNAVISELDDIAIKLIDALPDQIIPEGKKEQTLEEQFHHLVARHCDAATSGDGEIINKEIELPGIYDYSLKISVEKVGENEIDTTFGLQPTP